MVLPAANLTGTVSCHTTIRALGSAMSKSKCAPPRLPVGRCNVLPGEIRLKLDVKGRIKAIPQTHLKAEDFYALC